MAEGESSLAVLVDYENMARPGAKGRADFDIHAVLNRLSDKGRAKLEDYGIAPPQPAGGPDRCPRCGSAKVEKLSQFGSTPCKAQWRCTDCLEPFDYFKCI